MTWSWLETSITCGALNIDIMFGEYRALCRVCSL